MTQPASPVRRRRTPLPTGFFEQLPKFNRYVAPGHVKPASTSPTLAYVIVGPRVRGKFDAKKATELGVFGYLRAKLTAGETVTFNVKVGDEVVSRTVHPEDLIGESESPGVSNFTPPMDSCLIIRRW
jgi:ribonuclease Z